MAGKGNLKIHLSGGDGKRSVTATGGQQSEHEQRRQKQPQRQQEQGRQQQDQDDISDDDDGLYSSGPDAAPKRTPRELEIHFTGIEAVKICHFCKKELENLALYLRAKVTKEPSVGSPSKVTIKYEEKYLDNVTESMNKMKESLKLLSVEVVPLDVTKADDVRKLSKEYGEDSRVLIYISPMDRKVYVIADGYDKLSAALHRTKVSLGMVTTSKRGGRSLENTDSSSGNKLYPELPEANPDGHDHSSSRDNRRDYSHQSWHSSSPSSSDSHNDLNRHRRGQDENKYHGHRDGGGQYSSSSNEDFDFLYDFPSGFRLKVYKASITNLRVDAIVNAANDNLVHGGGVARAISKAAGYKLDKESNDYIKANGYIEVGDNCLTNAGRLPYDKVIHAVGPQWHDYNDKKECLLDLYKTVYKVLTTSDKERFKTVAMSAISAGIYAVPKELCADMYVQAVVDYAEQEKRYPEELHIIDVDVSILKLVEKSVRKWKESPDSIKPSETLKNYMKDRPAATGGMEQGRGRRYYRQFSDPVSKHNENDEIAGLQVRKQYTVPLKWGGEDSVFSVNESVRVHIYKGSIDKVVNVKAVVCSTDTSFGTTGYISRAFQDAFGEKYRKNFSQMKTKANYRATLGYVYTCETGSIYAPYVMHLAMKSLLYGNEGELKDYRTGLFNLFNEAEKRQFSKIALPLLGTGNVQTNSTVLKSCCRCVLEALRDFCNQGSNKHLLDIHLVNNSGEVNQLMVDTFKEAERSSSKPDRKDPLAGSHSFHRATSFDVTEQEKSSGHSSGDISPGSTRTYGSRSSSKPDRKDPLAGSHSFHRATSFDVTEQEKSSGHSSGDISPGSTRTYGSRSFTSPGSARLDSSSYNSSGKKSEEIEFGASGWSQSVKYKQSGFQEQPESKPSSTKKRGNLKIIEYN